MTTNNITVAHWGEHVDGGGERVATDIADAFGEDLYVGVKLLDTDSVELPGDGLPKRLARRGGVGQMVGYQFLWERPEPLADADTIVTSGNEPLAYVPSDGQTWVAYIHHTSRYATDLLDMGVSNTGGGLLSAPKQLAYRALRKAERHIYRGYASKPDKIVVNSDIVAKRVSRYWDVPESAIDVVYPGVAVDTYSRTRAPTEDVYLSLSRLDGHKRIEQIVYAAKAHRDKRFVVAGSGAEEDRLKELAPPNVEFVGYVSEERKRELLAAAKAFIVNAEAEDFGLTTVEALASGTPVIGVAEGMTQYLAAGGRGVTYQRGVAPLADAITRFEAQGVAKSPAEIEAFAQQFSKERFKREIRDVVDTARTESQLDVSWKSGEQIKPATPADSVRADGGAE